MAELSVVFLGTSAAVPTLERGLPCIAVVYQGSIVLLDVGEGCQYKLQRAGLSPLRVEAVFVSHLHGDHFFGLPGLLQSMAMAGRSRNLLVAGPQGLWGFIRASLEASRHDPGYRVLFKPVYSGFRVEAAGLRVEAFRVDHGVEAYGFSISTKSKKKLRVDLLRDLYGLEPGSYVRRLLEGERVVIGGRVLDPRVLVYSAPGSRIVYTGDTRPCDCVVEASKGASLLIHDSTFGLEKRREAIEQGHSTAWDAATIARRAGVGLLVLTHISARYRDPAPLLEEARRVFSNTIIAEDYMKIIVA